MKYPRTYHLPYSPGATKDDKKLQDGWFKYYIGQEIVITAKVIINVTTLPKPTPINTLSLSNFFITTLHHYF